MIMKEGQPITIESPEVVEKINSLIKSGVNPYDIDYDEIVFQIGLQKARDFYGDELDEANL